MTAKLNRAVRCTTPVPAVVASGTGASACGPSNDSSSNAAAPSGTAMTSSACGQGGTQDALKGSFWTGAKKAQQHSRADAVNGSCAAASNRCHTGELNYSRGSAHCGSPDVNAANQQIAAARPTNNGGRTRTLYGFPGIRLIGKTGQTWNLPRSQDKPSTITLHPGDSTALITMNILPIPANTSDSRPFAPGKALITPPDETTHVTLVRPCGGTLWDQAGTTPTPETFVNPIGLG
ncbi:DUF4232 domain-containing protein [Streptomyces sp. MMG1121]|uniref:DUF4232 domain-containing protein n=1 Tax=Streptomyces sp. MMG1121 TaxID=1415544 RepID=UPI0006AE68EA|nr:DUF4232 domain-containing protein [Streptomyces sp. MMG1121]KOV64021.1 hypothetical protein ADK64_17920 [Streptomyces sp. MMG1121]